MKRIGLEGNVSAAAACALAVYAAVQNVHSADAHATTQTRHLTVFLLDGDRLRSRYSMSLPREPAIRAP